MTFLANLTYNCNKRIGFPTSPHPPKFGPRIRVEFDPAFKVDRVCGTVKQKLSIVYQAAAVCTWLKLWMLRQIIQAILDASS